MHYAARSESGMYFGEELYSGNGITVHLQPCTVVGIFAQLWHVGEGLYERP